MQADDLISERYQIEKLAGRGGMGVVYRAVDRSTGRRVALKVLHTADPDDVRRFEREVQVLAELSHPGIVRYVGRGELADGQPYVTMEWLEGETLAQRLRRGALEIDEAIELGRRVGRALGAAHERGIVHRDLKPSNLMLVDGQVRQVELVDFGLARVADATHALTRSGDIMGTVMYMSPEQARAAHRADARADVFALGCILFESITGRRPFVGESVTAVLAKILFDEPPRVGEGRADVPAELDALVARMMSRRPESRPANGLAVAEQLERIYAPRPGTTPSPPSAPARLGETEQRVVCVLVVHPAREGPDGTVVLKRDAVATTPLFKGRKAASEHGVAIEVLADGTGIGVVSGRGTPADLAVRAAHCALSLCSSEPDTAIYIATGAGVVSDRVPVGEAIGRAVAGAARTPPSCVRLDEATAKLLEQRFAVERRDEQWELCGRAESDSGVDSLARRTTPFVGRTTELAILQALFGECVSSPEPKAAVLIGEAGCGKSRLLQELAQRAADVEPSLRVWIACGDPMTTRRLYGLAGAFVLQQAGVSTAQSVRDREARLLTTVSRHLDEDEAATASWFLAELAGLSPADEGRVVLAAARQDPSLMEQHIGRAWAQWLRAESAAAPLLLIVDDLQWGDNLSLKLLELALETADEMPLMVVAGTRVEAKERFGEVLESVGAVELRLRGLSKPDARKLVRKLEAGAPSKTDLEALLTRAGGNPFFLEELIHHRHEHQGGPLPDSVLGTIQGRLQGLGQRARRVLRAGSVFGNHFTTAGVAALLAEDFDAGMLEAELAALQAADFLLRNVEQRQTFSFRHSLVRDAAYAMLTGPDRTLGHGLAAEWLSRHDDGNPQLLAEHYELGEQPKRAAAHYLAAAERAAAASDIGQAIALAERGLGCGPTGVLQGELNAVAAIAYGRQGDDEASLRCSQLAVPELDPGSASWMHALGALMRQAALAGDSELSRRCSKQLCDTAAVDPKAVSIQAQELARGAHLVLQRGAAAEAARLRAHASVLVGSLDQADPGTEGMLRYGIAAQAVHDNDFAEALREFERSAELARKCGDRFSEAVRLANTASVRVQLGQFEQAEQEAWTALRTADELRARSLGAVTRLVLASTLSQLGRHDEAVELAGEALGKIDTEGHGRSLLAAQARNIYASVELARGELVHAKRLAAGAIGRTASLVLAHAWALGVLAQIQLAEGQPTQALESTTQAMAILDEHGGLEEGESELRLAHAEALRACGHPRQAANALHAAQQRLLANAARIDDPELRRSFLERPVAHARTMALRW